MELSCNVAFLMSRTRRVSIQDSEICFLSWSNLSVLPVYLFSHVLRRQQPVMASPFPSIVAPVVPHRPQHDAVLLRGFRGGQTPKSPRLLCSSVTAACKLSCIRRSTASSTSKECISVNFPFHNVWAAVTVGQWLASNLEMSIFDVLHLDRQMYPTFHPKEVGK